MNIKTAVGLLMLCSTGAQAGLLSLLDVATLKESELEMCPNISVEKMVNSFFEDPEWTGGKAADGRKLVNVSGTITYASQPARAMVQVWMQDDGFSVEALEINGRPQPEGMLDLLLEKMCQSARGTDHTGIHSSKQSSCRSREPGTSTSEVTMGFNNPSLLPPTDTSH